MEFFGVLAVEGRWGGTAISSTHILIPYFGNINM